MAVGLIIGPIHVDGYFVRCKDVVVVAAVAAVDEMSYNLFHLAFVAASPEFS